jgi:hypothetical protein
MLTTTNFLRRSPRITEQVIAPIEANTEKHESSKSKLPSKKIPLKHEDKNDPDLEKCESSKTKSKEDLPTEHERNEIEEKSTEDSENQIL